MSDSRVVIRWSIHAACELVSHTSLKLTLTLCRVHYRNPFGRRKVLGSCHVHSVTLRLECIDGLTVRVVEAALTCVIAQRACLNLLVDVPLGVALKCAQGSWVRVGVVSLRPR